MSSLAQAERELALEKKKQDAAWIAYESDETNPVKKALYNLATAEVVIADRKVKVAVAEANLEEIRKKDDSDPAKADELKKAEGKWKDEKAEWEVEKAKLEVEKAKPEGRRARLFAARTRVKELKERTEEGDPALEEARELVTEIEKENTAELLKEAKEMLTKTEGRLAELEKKPEKGQSVAQGGE